MCQQHATDRASGVQAKLVCVFVMVVAHPQTAEGLLPSINQIGNGLTLFINNSMDRFEAGEASFKATVEAVRSVYLQPSVRLQLACFTSVTPTKQLKQKHVVERLCSWLSTDEAFEPDRVSLAVQLARLWIFTFRNVLKSESTPLLKSSEIQPCLSLSEVQSLLESIGRSAADSITTLQEDRQSGGCVQSLALIGLGDLLCHTLLWLLSLPRGCAAVPARGKKDSSLSGLTQLFVLSVCKAIEEVINVNEVEKLDSLLESFCAVLTSPLFPRASLKTVMNHVAPLTWNLAINHPSSHCREVGGFCQSMLNSLSSSLFALRFRPSFCPAWRLCRPIKTTTFDVSVFLLL